MHIKRASVLFVILMAVTAQAPVQAQTRSADTGFLIGGGQPQNPLGTPASTNPVQGMTTPPIQGMTTPPILPLGGRATTTQTAPQTTLIYPQIFMGYNGNAVTVLPPGGTIFVPAGTLVVESQPGQQPGTFLTAPSTQEARGGRGGPGGGRSTQGFRGGGTSIQRSSRTDGSGQRNANPNSTEQDSNPLALGTPRDKVIEKYGNPVAYIMNMNGETLYFKSGVVVFVRDGVVASPVN